MGNCANAYAKNINKRTKHDHITEMNQNKQKKERLESDSYLYQNNNYYRPYKLHQINKRPKDDDSDGNDDDDNEDNKKHETKNIKHRKYKIHSINKRPKDDHSSDDDKNKNKNKNIIETRMEIMASYTSGIYGS
eukprot:235056_1